MTQEDNTPVNSQEFDVQPEALLGVAGPDDEAAHTAKAAIQEEAPRVAALREAASLITGDREQDYGAPEVNFQRIADIWSVLLGKEFTPSQVALAMIGLKLARTPEGYKRDTFIDLAGYAALVVELAEKGL